MPQIIQPIKDGDCKYSWRDIEVRTSKNAGKGIFAKTNLPIGTMIPILGHKLPEGSLYKDLSHGWKYNGSRGIIDGHPDINPYKNVASFGLSIAMMANESLTKIHNCRFRFDYLITARKIKSGEELTVYYGPDYETVRERNNYTLKNNKHLDHAYKQFFGIKFETKHTNCRTRKQNIDHWNSVIQECEATCEDKSVTHPEPGPVERTLPDHTQVYDGCAKLDVRDPNFESSYHEACENGLMPTLKPMQSEVLWPLENPYRFKSGADSGIYTSIKLEGYVRVLSEKGIMGKPNGLKLPSALLCSNVNLSFYGYPPDSVSPFPEYTLADWNAARLMVDSNVFHIGPKHILVLFVSQIKHSCSPNLAYRLRDNRIIDLVTTRPVFAGEQLTIQYSPKTGHEDTSFGFTCNCGRSLRHREMIYHDTDKLFERL